MLHSALKVYDLLHGRFRRVRLWHFIQSPQKSAIVTAGLKTALNNGFWNAYCGAKRAFAVDKIKALMRQRMSMSRRGIMKAAVISLLVGYNELSVIIWRLFGQEVSK